MLNPGKLFKIKAAWEKFAINHPKFISFIGALQHNYLKEGTVIEINVMTEEGKNISSNLRLTKEDIELFKNFSEMI